MPDKVALITGAAKRLGAATAKTLHEAGINVVVHYHRSKLEAEELVGSLNAKRHQSAVAVGAELGTQAQAQSLVERSLQSWGRLDVVVNNASSFYPTALPAVSDAEVHDLFASNFMAPLFVSQAAIDALKNTNGCIVNMADIHGQRPLDNHAVYSSAKAALIMLTRSMAKELAPEIRVNAIAPGAILWPDNNEMSSEQQATKLASIPMKCLGTPEQISQLVLFLSSEQANYITGEVISMDGGSSL